MRKKSVFLILLLTLNVAICSVLTSCGNSFGNVDSSPRQTDPDDSAISNVLAEEIAGEEIEAGDKILLVSDISGEVLSLSAQEGKIAPVGATFGEYNGKSVVTALSAESAIFEVTDAGNGSFYLKADEGYLTSEATGSGIFYSAETTECGKWRVEDNYFLYNVGAVFDNNGVSYRNNYLEYYNSSFTIYGKNTSSSVMNFLMNFYRMGYTPSESADEKFYLPVFETSDTHGYLADVTGEDPLYLLAYVSDKVKDVRTRGDGYDRDRAIFLDGGDIYQGNTLSNLLEGESLSAAYALMDYDAVTIGNHEFDWWIENTVDADGTMQDYDFDDTSGKNGVPVVVSNLYFGGEKIGFAEDYIILEKTAVNKAGEERNVKVGVIGFVGDYSRDIMTDKFTGAGYSIRTDYTLLNELAARLESEGLCDATIVLTHEEASVVATGIGAGSVVDLVLGGHTHRSIVGSTDSGLCYIQPASFGEAYAYCELSFSVKEDVSVFEKVVKAKPVSTVKDSSKLKNIDENSEELDASVVDLTDTVIEKLLEILDTRIGYITESAYRYSYIENSGYRSTSCGNWISSIIARIVGADVAFVNNGGLRNDVVLPDGRDRRYITLSDVYTMFPFDNRIYCYELTYEELLTVFQYSLTEPGKQLFSQQIGIDCYYANDTVNALVAKDGTVIYANGEWGDGMRDKKVRLAVSEYLATTEKDPTIPNPLRLWADKLISSDKIDNIGAAEVLTEESVLNDGLLFIDVTAHFINSEFVE